MRRNRDLRKLGEWIKMKRELLDARREQASRPKTELRGRAAARRARA
ncbi:MAG: hypothetical protein U1F11_04740 [Steroidobacteraceae bacterium]